MVKFGVLFEVRTEFLNIINTSVGVKGLNNTLDLLCISYTRVSGPKYRQKARSNKSQFGQLGYIVTEMPL
jgi:hypothetical protein